MTALVSCGAVLLGPGRALFVCRTTGKQRWDLPKGVADPGEAPRATAVRETWEECGLVLPPDALRDLGEFAYLPAKRLHLFALHVAAGAFDPADCRCRSFFPHWRTGRPTPEADAFAWQPLDTLAHWCGKNMTRVLAALSWDEIAAMPAAARIEVDVDSPIGP